MAENIIGIRGPESQTRESTSEQEEVFDEPEVREGPGAVKEEEEKKEPSFLHILTELPTGLSKKVFMEFLTGAAFFVGTIVVLIMTKTPEMTFGFLLAAWFIWMGLSIVFDWQSGEIVEMALVCVSCTKQPMQSQLRVMFRTPNEEIPSYYEYRFPSKNRTQFMPNMTYIIYTRRSLPQILLGYQAM